MGRSSEEELWLAQGKALRDPRPDVPHLLGTDNLRGEGVGVKCQLHVPPGDAPQIWTQGETGGTECTDHTVIDAQLVMHKPLKVI